MTTERLECVVLSDQFCGPTGDEFAALQALLLTIGAAPLRRSLERRRGRPVTDAEFLGETMIGWQDPENTSDGHDRPYGMYAWLIEYPEEGEFGPVAATQPHQVRLLAGRNVLKAKERDRTEGTMVTRARKEVSELIRRRLDALAKAEVPSVARDQLLQIRAASDIVRQLEPGILATEFDSFRALDVADAELKELLERYRQDMTTDREKVHLAWLQNCVLRAEIVHGATGVERVLKLMREGVLADGVMLYLM